jgi:hypothetical protein
MIEFDEIAPKTLDFSPQPLLTETGHCNAPMPLPAGITI